MERLLSIKGDLIGSKDERKWTALHFASSEGRDDIVEVLLRKYEAPPNAMSADGMSPLMIACMRGHKKVVERLLLAGSDANLTTSDGDTALHMLAKG